MPLFLWRWISHERKAVPRASAVPLRPERRYSAAVRMAATGFGGRRRTRRRFHLRRRQTGRQQGLGGRAPREPCHLHRSRPEHEEVGALDESAESLERGHRLQVDRYLLGSPPGDRRRMIWISGPGQPSGCAGGIDFGLDHLRIPEPSISIDRHYSVASHHGFDQNWC
jgi:hypothetical protein